ncbi:MAG: aminotransferase class V-fold PLP-dependent enzyme [Verrucomicrobia bacterium]|nr:aminotransferase class V-fold PLP-dependent enzyme [Verrucomicrobiota bacterium]
MKLGRRSLLKSLGLAGLAGSWLPWRRAEAAGSKRNIYQDLGIRPVLNFRGTVTAIGASKEWPELHEAMSEAARHFVVLDELQDKIGERLARLLGSEDAMVTTGAAGAITLGTCASLTGSDGEKIRRLPDLRGMKTEVVIQKVHRNDYDHAVRNTGVKLIEVESKEQMLNAVGPQTAMMFYLGGSTGDWAWETPVPLDECLGIARKAGFPVMVDAANMLPPWDNLRKLAALGTDLICISGGKHLRGPQCSGILAGRKDLIHAARLNSNPHSNSLGRPLKVGREEMVGVYLAAEKYARLDFAALERQSFEQAEFLSRELRKIPGMEVSYEPHDRTRRVHRVVARWNEAARRLTAKECERRLMEGEPRIAALTHKAGGLLFTVFMNEPGDEKHLARRMREIFEARG